MSNRQKYNDSFTDVEIYCMKLDKFKLIKELGKGSIGRIYMAEYIQTGRIYALKFIKSKYGKYVINGLKVSTSFDHPNLMKFYGYFLQNHKGELYIISIIEYIEGLDLHQIYKKRSISYIYTILPTVFCQVISGLQYIHSLGVIHRDIKLENIIVNRNNMVKIIDYDFLVQIGDNIDYSGTPFYIAPEIIQGLHTSEKADIWSLGVTIYTILVGDYPFDSENDLELFMKIENNNLNEYLIPRPYRTLIKGMLEKDPNKRISLADSFKLLKRLQ